MSDDDYYFRLDLVGSIEPILKLYGLSAVHFTWDGQAMNAITFLPLETAPGDLPFNAASAAEEIQRRVQSELAGSYRENRGVPFRFVLDLVKDLSELYWGLED